VLRAVVISAAQRVGRITGIGTVDIGLVCGVERGS
jgi:hypothetical protein